MQNFKIKTLNNDWNSKCVFILNIKIVKDSIFLQPKKVSKFLIFSLTRYFVLFMRTSEFICQQLPVKILCNSALWNFPKLQINNSVHEKFFRIEFNESNQLPEFMMRILQS